MAKRFRVVKWVILIVMLALLVGGGAMAWMARTPPSYWQEPAEIPAAQLEQMEQVGVALENRLPGEFTQPRTEGEIWTCTLTQNEMNAWITTRMTKWLRSQGEWLEERGLPTRLPQEFKHPMVDITPKRLALAAEAEVEGKKQIVSCEFSSFKGPNDIARVRLNAIKGGRLPLPRGILDMLIEKLGSEEKAREQAITAASLKLQETDLIIPLSGGWKVNILDAKVDNGAVTLTCQSFSAKSEQ